MALGKRGDWSRAARERGVARTVKSRVKTSCQGDAAQHLAPAADLMPEPIPVWLAALIAARCAATVEGGIHAVEWNHVRGRAIYTNSGAETEMIHPLGVRLAGGDTVAVSWIPGETAYTVEVIRHPELFA